MKRSSLEKAHGKPAPIIETEYNSDDAEPRKRQLHVKPRERHFVNAQSLGLQYPLAGHIPDAMSIFNFRSMLIVDYFALTHAKDNLSSGVGDVSLSAPVTTASLYRRASALHWTSAFIWQFRRSFIYSTLVYWFASFIHLAVRSTHACRIFVTGLCRSFLYSIHVVLCIICNIIIVCILRHNWINPRGICQLTESFLD